MESKLREKITERIREYLTAIPDLDVIDIALFSNRSDSVVRVIVDHENGGITLSTCAQINRAIAEMMEKEFPEENVIIEVNSPGIDRFFTREKDFLKHKGKRVGIWLKDTSQTSTYKEGEIVDVREGTLIINRNSIEERISVSLISKAKQIVTWR
jgi:ribosome maturation factor RimP